jgi:hypothetical protein
MVILTCIFLAEYVYIACYVSITLYKNGIKPNTVKVLVKTYINVYTLLGMFVFFVLHTLNKCYAIINARI